MNDRLVVADRLAAAAAYLDGASARLDAARLAVENALGSCSLVTAEGRALRALVDLQELVLRLRLEVEAVAVAVHFRSRGPFAGADLDASQGDMRQQDNVSHDQPNISDRDARNCLDTLRPQSD